MNLLFIQLILLISCFLLVQHFVYQEIVFQCEVWATLFLGWLISVWLTHKHKPKLYQKKIKYILAPYPKALIVNILFIFIVCQFFESIRIQLNLLLITVGLYGVTEYIFLYLWLRYKLSKNFDVPVSSDTRTYIQNDLDLTSPPPPKYIPADIIVRKLETKNSEFISSLYHNTVGKFDQKGDANDLLVGDIDELIHTDRNRLSLVVLKTRINDLKKINEAFIKCYGSLIPGGYFITCYNNIDDIEAGLKKRFPQWLYHLIFPFHFLFCRVFSKIYKLDKTQEWLSRGRNKVLSWVEVSGRLAYCGFDVENEERYNGKQYVIARKTKTVSDDPNPSYYIFIKLKRISLYGNIIKINKIRSMYPYSEFLQKKVFEKNSIGNIGKFKDDPRITPQGKIFRKYWIDELPQLIDWFRGEIKLVGIRAMSLHFFSLYPKEYQALFVKVKPGILSPIFDETAVDFNSIVETESKYLQSYLEHPMLTDISYFFMTIHQIIFRGTRSK